MDPKPCNILKTTIKHLCMMSRISGTSMKNTYEHQYNPPEGSMGPVREHLGFTSLTCFQQIYSLGPITGNSRKPRVSSWTSTQTISHCVSPWIIHTGTYIPKSQSALLHGQITGSSENHRGPEHSSVSHGATKSLPTKEEKEENEMCERHCSEWHRQVLYVVSVSGAGCLWNIPQTGHHPVSCWMHVWEATCWNLTHTYTVIFPLCL